MWTSCCNWPALNMRWPCRQSPSNRPKRKDLSATYRKSNIPIAVVRAVRRKATRKRDKLAKRITLWGLHALRGRKIGTNPPTMLECTHQTDVYYSFGVD